MFEKIELDTEWIKKCRRGAPATAYGNILYYKVMGAIPPKLITVLQPSSIRFVEIEPDHPVQPHYDHGIITALNLYIEGGDGCTQFWEPKAGAQPIKYENSKITNSYNRDDLIKTGAFTANDGDAYILDISKIHSVDGPLTRTRRFVQFSWARRTYTDVLVSLSSLV